MKAYKLLWRMLTYRPWLYLLTALLWLLIGMSDILPGLVTRAFFDTLTGSAELRVGVWAILALLGAIALGRAALVAGGALTDILYRFMMSALLRRNMLSRILELPGARSLPDSPSEALTRFREDAEQAEDHIGWTLDMVGALPFAVTAVIILFRVNPHITVYVFLPLVVVTAAAQMAAMRIQHYRKLAREATGRVTDAIGEIFGSVQAVKVAGSEEAVVGHLRRLNETRRRAMLKDRSITLVLQSIYFNTVSLGTGLILLLAAGSMRAGTFTVGDFSLFVYYLALVTDCTMFFGEYLAHYRQTAVSLERMTELLGGAPPERLVEHTPLGSGTRFEFRLRIRPEARPEARSGTGLRSEDSPACRRLGRLSRCRRGRRFGRPAQDSPGQGVDLPPPRHGPGHRRCGSRP